jgi:hypothetical protein
MKIERAWKNGGNKADDPWTEITEDRAARDLANDHGDDAVEKLRQEKTLETRFGKYRVVE